MQIDLKKEFTMEDVRKLIGSVDDSEHRQLRITKEGIAGIEEIKRDEQNDYSNLLCRFEIWAQGNGYTGQEAAKDDKWVKRVYDDLKENYPEPKDSYIDW